MRISKGALAVLLAFTVPVVVQFRTVAAFLGFEVGVVESLLVGSVLVALIIAWALWPEGKEPVEGNPEDDDDGHPT